MFTSDQSPSQDLTTGRFIVVFGSDDPDAPSALADAGLRDVADSRDLATPEARRGLSGTHDMYFAELGMAVVSADEGQLEGLRSRSVPGREPVGVWPELIHHALVPNADTGRQRESAGSAGDSAGADASAGFPASAPAEAAPDAEQPSDFTDNDQFTWGLQATLASVSQYSGQGIKVAVLDTGFDLQHPDFAGRTVVAESFVAGEDAQDGHGHGTHCIGTSCGPRTLDSGRGYGVAYAADIYAGKVLSNAGSGSDANILAGIDWAVAHGCAVISMSLGADVAQVHPPYVAAGKRALAKGTLIVAAAGNNARRSAGNFGFVGAPANSPYIMAVGALDGKLQVADFSARTLPGIRGGQVDVAGPGVKVYSSWPMPERYNIISGTSMATPHAAGIAALLAESTGLRGRELWAQIVQEGRRLPVASVDVAAGLVQAPENPETTPAQD